MKKVIAFLVLSSILTLGSLFLRSLYLQHVLHRFVNSFTSDHIFLHASTLFFRYMYVVSPPA